MIEEAFEETTRKGGAKFVMIIALIVAAVVVAACFLMNRGGPTGGATVTVTLHDAETIDLGQLAEEYLPDIPGVSLSISGVVTVNSFSVTDVTVKLYDENTDGWVTVANNQTVTDMIAGGEFTANIPAGTYNKVSVYIGAITADIEWTDISLTGTIEGFGPGQEYSFSIPSGDYNNTLSIDQEFIISFTPVTITGGGTIDVDTGSPFRLASSGSGMGMSFDFGKGQLDSTKMRATASVS